MSDYSNSIKGIKPPPWDLGRHSEDFNRGYDAGHGQAKADASTIAKQADARIAELEAEREEFHSYLTMFLMHASDGNNWRMLLSNIKQEWDKKDAELAKMREVLKESRDDFNLIENAFLGKDGCDVTTVCGHASGLITSTLDPSSDEQNPNREKLYYMQDCRNHVGNSMLWWAKNHHGYTCDIRKAHIWTESEVLQNHTYRESDRPWPKDYIDSRVSHHIDMQHCDLDFAMKITELARVEGGEG